MVIVSVIVRAIGIMNKSYYQKNSNQRQINRHYLYIIYNINR